MIQIIQSGDSAGLFSITIDTESERDLQILEESDNPFEWLEKTGRTELRSELIARTAFRAIVRDMLSCISDSLQCAKKQHITQAYMLIRKPIQESLFVLESLSQNKNDFSQALEEPMRTLRPHSVGGIDGHIKRITNVLELNELEPLFNAEYLARVRYDKRSRDNFDGICNKAMHLFTEHEAIRTESSNINLVFSGADETLTQLLYFYSRLPYLLFYMLEVLQSTIHTIALTHPSYLEYQYRRIYSLLILAAKNFPDEYQYDELDNLCRYAEIWLKVNSLDNGKPMPKLRDLPFISRTGGLPGETKVDIQARVESFARLAGRRESPDFPNKANVDLSS